MSTENTVQPFDMQAVQNRVQESIKSQFAMLIGDAAFDKLVEAAIKEFFYTEKQFEFREVRIPNKNGYGHETKYVLEHALTAFQAMIWEELQQHTRTALREWAEREKKNIKEMVDAVFAREPDTTRTVFHLNVEQLAKEMAARAHYDLINQAADRFSYSLQNLSIGINEVRSQLNLPSRGY